MSQVDQRCWLQQQTNWHVSGAPKLVHVAVTLQSILWRHTPLLKHLSLTSTPTKHCCHAPHVKHSRQQACTDFAALAGSKLLLLLSALKKAPCGNGTTHDKLQPATPSTCRYCVDGHRHGGCMRRIAVSIVLLTYPTLLKLHCSCCSPLHGPTDGRSRNTGGGMLLPRWRGQGKIFNTSHHNTPRKWTQCMPYSYDRKAMSLLGCS
jgi:hypothetical protein